MTNLVFSKVVSVSEELLVKCINTINRYYDVENGDVLITKEEVLGNEKLLTYICEGIIDEGIEGFDELEFWNADGWCDVEDYR